MQSETENKATSVEQIEALIQKVGKQYEDYVRLNEVSDLAAYLNESNAEFLQINDQETQTAVNTGLLIEEAIC